MSQTASVVRTNRGYATACAAASLAPADSLIGLGYRKGDMGLFRRLFGPANLRGVVIGDGQFKFAIIGTPDHQEELESVCCRGAVGPAIQCR
jgi:hypothetical protein